MYKQKPIHDIEKDLPWAHAHQGRRESICIVFHSTRGASNSGKCTHGFGVVAIDFKDKKSAFSSSLYRRWHKVVLADINVGKREVTIYKIIKSFNKPKK